MLNRKIILSGVGIFLFSFSMAVIWVTWKEKSRVSESAFSACAYHLKSLWLISRRISDRYQTPFPPHFSHVSLLMRKSFLITEREANYLGMPEISGTYMTFSGILICPNDPDYLFKLAMLEQGLSYQPSYQWRPDNRTLAYCPYCRMAVLLDGTIEKR